MKLGFPTRGRAGFTLIELVISGALMTLILSAAYLCFSAGVASESVVEARSESVQSARVALEMMAADLRSAVPLSAEFEFLGMHRALEGRDADNLDFATRHYFPRTIREGEFCEVSYFVSKDPKTGEGVLFRRRDPTPDPEPLEGGSREEILRGVRELRFEYYDGFDWYDEWGDPTGKKQTSTLPPPNVTGLPEAVRIVLTVDGARKKRGTAEAKSEVTEDSKEPPLTFETTARLEMASYFYSAAASSGSPSNSQNSQSSQNGSGPSAPNPGGLQ